MKTEPQMTPLVGGFRINFNLLSKVLQFKAQYAEDMPQAEYDKRVARTNTRTVNTF